MPVWKIHPGQNPEAAGTVTFGIEGEDPVMVLDSEGNVTFSGNLSAASGGGGGDVTLSTPQTITATKTWDVGAADPAQVVNAEDTGQTADLMQFWSGSDTGQGNAPQKTTYMNEKGELRVISARSNSIAVRVKGQPSQSVDIFQITDTGNNVISRADSAGDFRSPTIGQMYSWGLSGAASVEASPSKVRNITGRALTFYSAAVQVGTAPTGSALTIDVKSNGTTILTAPISVAAGQTASSIVTAFATATWAAGNTLTVEVTAVGSTVAGSDVVVQVYAG